NTLCEAGEDTLSCPEDCGFCGDLTCDSCAENSDSCEDCYCGDFICDIQEDAVTCPTDCLGSICGDLVCDWNGVWEGGWGESPAPVCTGGPYCGDGHVDPGEDCDDGNTADGDCCN